MNESIAQFDVPPSTERVPRHTEERINRRIEREMEKSVCFYQHHPELIDERLDELAREWDVERVLESNAATLSLASLVLGELVNRKWLLLTGTVTGFLSQHGVQGWCPPLPILRRLGFRTRDEIRTEMLAIRSIRGDFDHLDGHGAAEPRDLVDSVKRWTPGDEDDAGEREESSRADSTSTTSHADASVQE